MISLATSVLGISVSVFFFLLVIVGLERRRGRRFIAVRLRGWLDEKVNNVGSSIIRNWEHFLKYILQLHWYYSIHSVLRTCLRFITAFYAYFENLFERNRNRTKQLRAEKRQLNEMNHLHQMAEHKEDTALTPSQKKKLRNKQLEGKH